MINYSVSPYISGMSISCTVICHSDGVIIFPPNVQRSYVGKETDYRILFEGSDFVMGNNLNTITKNQIYSISKKFGESITEMGYRGVCGIDFVINNSNISILEVNPRFLGSSFIINTALADENLPSLAFFHLAAFQNASIDNKIIKKINNLNIPYFSMVVTNRGFSTERYMEEVLSSIKFNTKICMD